MHPSVEPEQIIVALQEIGHTATNVWNMKHGLTKTALQLFVVELKQNVNNKEIYGITLLLNSRIAFEPPRPKREIPQCSICQQYGHTKSGCRRKPKCIKCAGDHASAECLRKARTSDVKCALCDGNHPANYKGCIVYQKLKTSTFPSLRKKVLPEVDTNEKNSKQQQQSLNQQQQQSPHQHQQQQQTPQQDQGTYAQAVTGKTIRSSYSGLQDQNLQPASEEKHRSQVDCLINEMLKMLSDVISQMTASSNLVLSLVSKLVPCP